MPVLLGSRSLTDRLTKIRDPMTCSVIITTCPNIDEAKQLATLLIKEKLAACVQLSNIESYYIWEGKACHEPEIKLLIKTRHELYPEVETFIRSHHSYSVPEIIELPIQNGLSTYLDWIFENTRDKAISV